MSYFQEYTAGYPFVSVVIPVYDRTDLLVKSIESILNQTYKNFELIIVCDGSPPETLATVDAYKNHPKVRIFKFSTNSGNAVRGRNLAIAVSRGEFLAFQDSDDIAEPNRLELSVAYINHFNVDVIYGMWRVIGDGSRKGPGPKVGTEVVCSDCCNVEILKKYCIPGQSTVMARVSALRAVGGLKPKMRYREDHELWLRLAHYGFKFKYIPRILTNIRFHQNNLELVYLPQDSKWYELMLREYMYLGPLAFKIGYVIPACVQNSGIATICYHANHLLNRGYNVTLISADGSHVLDWFSNNKVPVIPLSQVNQKYDILIATFWTTAYLVNEMKAKRKMYFVQADERKFYEKNSDLALQAGNSYRLDLEIFTMAKSLQDFIFNEYQKESSYVPIGVDDTVMQYPPLIPKGDKIRVLIEGPLDAAHKAISDAFETVRDLNCEVVLVTNSGRPRREWCYDYFFENIPLEYMKSVYSSCDILLKLSGTETFSYTPLDMMACGGCCVLSLVNDNTEYLIDGYNALLVKPGDIDGAKLAVKMLMENNELRQKLIKGGRETVSRWSWDISIDKLELMLADSSIAN